jgi:DNA polymerase III delta' subunit
LETKLNNGRLGIAGNLPVQERLYHYLLGGRLHPAAILAGDPGSGKLALAKNIAKHLLCKERPPEKAFCAKCSACRRIDGDIHPDVLITREPDEDIIKIDTVRDICHQMSLTPVEGPVKICIVDECHRMNVASANAFLKTLEEPGPNRFFWLLTSQPGSLLPTILSRCLKFRLRPEAAAAVETVDFPQWDEALQSRDPAALLAALDKKEKVQAFVSFLQKRLRDELITGSPRQSAWWLLERFENSLELEARLRSNANYGLMLESFLTQNFFEAVS